MDERCRILIVTALLAVATQDVVAQGPQDDAVSSRQANSARPHTLLVLVDGKVLRGRLVPRPDGYDVSTTSGRVFISSDRVRFTAPVVAGMRVRLRMTLAELTPSERGSTRLKWTTIVDIEGKPRPALAADWLWMVVEEETA